MATHHFLVRRQSARPGGRGRGFGVASIATLCCLGLLLLAGTGCRSGVRSLSAPKWPSLGGGAKPADAAALASVPSSDGPIKMPSASATPYATTSTPAGYVVNDPAGGSGAGAESIQTAASDPSAVTYGVTPPMAEPASSEPPPPAAALADASAPIAPQVGRYATLPTPPPAAEAPAAPGIPPASADAPGAFAAAAPPPAGPPGGGYPTTPAASTAFPTTAGYEPAAPAAEVASAPIAAAAPALATPEAAPPLTPIAEPPAGPPARYASRGSRYAGGSAAEPPSTPGLAPLPVAAAGAAGAAFGADAALANPQSAPAAVPLEAPASAPAVLPAAIPDGLTSPPVRRRDPGYRPGGTSSYRPADQIFVDDDPLPPSPVRTASYEVIDSIPAPPVQR